MWKTIRRKRMLIDDQEQHTKVILIKDDAVVAVMTGRCQVYCPEAYI